MCKPIYQRFLRQKSIRCVMQIAKHYLHSHKAQHFLGYFWSKKRWWRNSNHWHTAHNRKEELQMTRFIQSKTRLFYKFLVGQKTHSQKCRTLKNDLEKEHLDMCARGFICGNAGNHIFNWSTTVQYSKPICRNLNDYYIYGMEYVYAVEISVCFVVTTNSGNK